MLSLLFLLASIIAGPERPVSETPLVPATNGNVRTVATDGNDYLVLFSIQGLYASRVSAAGDVAAAPLVPIDPNGAAGVAAVWTGSSYLVVWSAQGTLTSITLDRDGKPLRTPSLVGLSANISASGISFNGTHVFLLYDQGLQLHGMLLNPDGSLVRAGIDVPAAPLKPLLCGVGTHESTVVNDGSRFAVFWVNDAKDGYEHVNVMRFTDSGEPFDTAPHEFQSLYETVAFLGAAFDDSHYAVSYAATQGSTHTVRRTLVDPKTLHFDRLTPLYVGGPNTPVARLLFNGSDFVAVTSTTRTFVIPFAAGTQFDVPGNPIAWAVATNGRSVLVSSWQTTGALVDMAGNVIKDSFPLAYAPRGQQAPVMASTGAQSLVAWVEPDALLAKRIDGAGFPIDAAPIVVRSASNLTPFGTVFAGNAYFVFWGEETRLMMQRIGGDGRLLGAPTQLPLPGEHVGVGTNGATVLVVSGAKAMRLDTGGNALDSITTFSDSTWAIDGLPRVASNGSDYLVVFAAAKESLRPLFGVRVTGGGTALDAARPLALGSDARRFSNPDVAFDGRGYVVTYGVVNGNLGNAEALKVLPDGTIGGAPIVLGASSAAVAQAPFGTVVAASGGAVRLSLLDGSLIARIDGASSPAMAATSHGVVIAYLRNVNGSPHLFVRLAGNVSPRPRAAR